VPKENEPKEKALSQKAFLQLTLQNQVHWPELPTGIRQFFTTIAPYAAAKGFPSREFRIRKWKIYWNLQYFWKSLSS